MSGCLLYPAATKSVPPVVPTLGVSELSARREGSRCQDHAPSRPALRYSASRPDTATTTHLIGRNINNKNLMYRYRIVYLWKCLTSKRKKMAVD